MCQAEHLGEPVDRWRVKEFGERRHRRSPRDGLPSGRGDGIGHLVRQRKRKSAEDIGLMLDRPVQRSYLNVMGMFG